MNKLSDFWKNSQYNINYAWLIAGGYLIYLGGSTIYSTIQGKAELPLVLSLLIGVLFIAGGAFLLYREWKHAKAANASAKENQDITNVNS